MSGPRVPEQVLSLRQALETSRSGSGFTDGAGLRVTDWRMTWTASRGAEVGVKDGEPANVYSPLTMVEGLSARLLVQWSDGRISSRRVERAAFGDPESVLTSALASAWDDPDRGNFAGPREVPDLPLHVPETAEVVAGRVEPMSDLLALAAGKARAFRFDNHSGSVSASVSRAGVVTSRGCEVEGESTSFSYSFWFDGLAGDGHTRREPIAADVADGRLDRACEYAARLKRAEPAFGGGTMPVLLHPNVAGPVFATFVFGNLYGESIWNGQSAFRIAQFRERERVLREDLTVRLEPLVPYGPGSFRFTSEGVPARRLDYVSDGRLVTPILDLKYARRFGMDPTPAPSSMESVLIEAAGKCGPSEALASMNHGLLVLGILGLHTQDATSGDFSLSAPQTLAVRRGAMGGRVKAALSGNFFEALRSTDLRLVAFPDHHTPGLLFPVAVSVD